MREKHLLLNIFDFVEAHHSANKGTDLATMMPKQFFEDLLPLGLSVLVHLVSHAGIK